MPNKITEPYLTVAVFCERALEEKDGIISAIRVVDRLHIKPAAFEAIDKNNPALIQIIFLLKFTSINYAGKRTLSIKSEAPNKKVNQIIGDTPIVFEADKMGVQVRVLLTIAVKQEGTYWVTPYLDGETFMRVPLEIRFQDVSLEQTSK